MRPMTQVEMLNDLCQFYEGTSPNIAENIKKYLDNRESFIHEHSDKYVHITEDGIWLSASEDEKEGICFKVGEEVHQASQVLRR